MNALSALLGGGENLDTYLLLILIFMLLRAGDESGTVFALGYLLFADDVRLPAPTPSERRFPPPKGSKRPPPGDCRR